MAREPGRASQDSSFAAGEPLGASRSAADDSTVTGSVTGVFLGAGDCIERASPTPRHRKGRDRWRSSPEDPRPTSFRAVRDPFETVPTYSPVGILLQRCSSSLSNMDGSSAATRFREHGETYDSMRRSIRSTSFGKAKRKICERWAKEGVAERPEKLPQKMPCLDPSHEHGRDKKPQSAGTWGYPVPVKSLSNIMEPSQGETMPASFDGLCSCCGVATKKCSQQAREGSRTCDVLTEFFDGRTTFGTEKKWYQRRQPGDGGAGPQSAPQSRKIAGGRFNRHRSMSFIDLVERDGRKTPGPALYNPQDAGIFKVSGGRFNMSRPKTHWQLIEKKSRSQPSGADTTCNSPWGHKNPLLPGAGRMPRGGRICFERHQEGVGKLYGTSFLIRKPEDEVLNHTPGPGEYALRM